MKTARSEPAAHDDLEFLRAHAAGAIHYGQRLAAGGGWRDYRALLGLADAIKAEAARLYARRDGGR